MPSTEDNPLFLSHSAVIERTKVRYTLSCLLFLGTVAIGLTFLALFADALPGLAVIVLCPLLVAFSVFAALSLNHYLTSGTWGAAITEIVKRGAISLTIGGSLSLVVYFFILYGIMVPTMGTNN